MEYQEFIEKHECLKGYFSEFPKLLHRLASEGRSFLKFHQKMLLVDSVGLSDYLRSSESIFPIRDIVDFFETLHVLKFSRVHQPRSETRYFFTHSNFDKDQAVPDGLYKQKPNDASISSGARCLRVNHQLGLFDRLLLAHKTRESKMSKLDFARLRLKFVLQKRLDLKRCEKAVFTHDIGEPDYVVNQEIAGYYGNVEFAMLKNAFGDYFPVYYTEEPLEPPMNVDPPEPPTSVEPPESAKRTLDEATQEVPQSSDSTSVGVDPACDMEENKENEPPQKRARRCSKRITARETNAALINLQKELDHLYTDH